MTEVNIVLQHLNCTLEVREFLLNRLVASGYFIEQFDHVDYLLVGRTVCSQLQLVTLLLNQHPR